MGGPEHSTEMAAVTDTCCVVRHCHAEGLCPARDVQIFQQIASWSLGR